MIRLAILDGYVQGQSGENRCDPYNAGELGPYDFWNDYFKTISTSNKHDKYDVRRIPALDISDSFAVILNPFGEAYPELSLDRKQVYNSIRNFIRNGGVFVNTAGFPFFYVWLVRNSRTDNMKPVSEDRLLLPRITISGGTATIEQLQEVIRFTGTLYYRDFGAATTFDTEVVQGAVPLKPYQTKEDTDKFGDLLEGIESVTEFRALSAPGLKEGISKCIPLVRAKREPFGEVYPMAALRHGRGYLLVGAMGMTSTDEKRLFAKGVDRFCYWMSKQ